MLTLVALVIALLFLPSPWNVVVVGVAAVVDLIETAVFLWWSRRRRRGPAAVGIESIVGRSGVALTRLEPGAAAEGQVKVDGEIWNARTSELVERGNRVTVGAVAGLTLDVTAEREA